jgi:hypothetical protein
MRPADRAQFSTPSPRLSFRADQPVGELGFAEQFVIWAMRVQWTHIGDGRQQSLVVQRACRVIDMPEGASLVAELTEGLMHACERPLSVPCPKWRVLTSDEARLLGFIAALQTRDGAPLIACDPEWRSPAHAKSIWAPAQRLALALGAAGLHLGTMQMGEAAFPAAMPQLH